MLTHPFEADKHRQMRKVLRSVTESSYIDSLYPSFDIICSHGDETYPDIYIETQKGHLVFHGLMKTDVAKNGLKACINKYLKEGFQSFETKITNIFNNPQECLPPRQVYSTGTICFFNQFESYSVLLYPAHLSSESDQKTFLKDFAILADQVCKDVSENPKIEQSEEALVAMGNTHAPLLNLFKKAGKIALALQTMPSDIECFANTAADLRYCDRKEYEGAWIRTIFNNNNIKLLKNVGLPLTLCAEKLTYDALLRISVTVADRILQFGNTPVIQTILQNHHANSITAFIADDKSGIANDILSLLDVYAQATIIENKKVLNSIKKALENPKYAEPDQLQKLTNKAMLKLNVVATHNEHKQPLNDTEINRDYTTQ